jgi:hypothetical protein
MKRGMVLQNEKNQYLTGGYFWTSDIESASIFDDRELEFYILPNYMKWDWKPVWAYPAESDESGFRNISKQPVPFWKIETGDF